MANGSLDYVEWALDAPMFLIKRGDEVIENTAQTFRVFMEQGSHGHRATKNDWETHLNTLFPEVRLKRTLEVRSADSQPASLLCALPAFWTGILYDDRALDAADDLSRSFTARELEALRPLVAEHALGAIFRGAPLADLAQRVVDISMTGLERRGRRDRAGRDERQYLASVADLVEKGWCPADVLIDGLDNGDKDLQREILARARI